MVAADDRPGAMSRRGDRQVTVWRGDYAFGRDDSAFREVVRAARKYADRDPDRRPEEGRFREELERLRRVVPADGRVLLDQLEHRWAHPDCPPCLYVLTCTLRAPERGTLLDDHGQPIPELLCTKVGRAKRTLAARIDAYMRDPLGGVSVVEASPTLRVVVYGDGPAMPSEPEVQRVAKDNGSHAEVVHPGGARRRVGGGETYVGPRVIDAVTAFARHRASA